MTQQWGDFPGGSIPGLPAQRMGYNMATGRGLGNLDKNKTNLINVAWNGCALTTSEKPYCSGLSKMLQACEGYDVILVGENEQHNKNVITNTTLPRYLSCLGWAKNVADSFGVRAMEGGEMMPASYRLYQDTLQGDEKKEFAIYMRNSGLNVGGSAAAYNAAKTLEFCERNGIMGNFHSQKDYIFLSPVIDCLRGYCPDMSNNEIAVRSGDVKEVAGIVAAVTRLSYVIWYNQDIGKNAKQMTKEQVSMFLDMM